MREQTANAHMEPGPPEADGQELLGVALPDQYLGFFLRSQLYAFPISSVVKIVNAREDDIKPFPRQPAHMKGILNWAGENLSVIDAGICAANVASHTTDPSLSIIVVGGVSDERYGLLVDKVHNMIKIPQEKINEPLSLAHGFAEGENATRIAQVEVEIDGHREVQIVFLMDFEQFLPDQARGGNTKRRAPVCSQG